MNQYSYPSLRYILNKEFDLLQELAQGLPNNPIVVNIGAGNGCSSLAFLLSRPDLRLITVDIQKEPHPKGCLSAEYDTLVNAGIDMSRHQQIYNDSKLVGKKRSIKADMVFIDGDHTYQGCRGDIEAWTPRIKPGGVLAIHDYEPVPIAWPGVYQAVNELLIPEYQVIGRVDNLIAFRVPS